MNTKDEYLAWKPLYAVRAALKKKKKKKKKIFFKIKKKKKEVQSPETFSSSFKMTPTSYFPAPPIFTLLWSI